MLIWSISSTVTTPTPHAAHFTSLAYSASRFSIGRFLESSIPRGNLSRSRMQAAAITGPASGAHPASSTPANGCGKSSSSLKVQRRGIESTLAPLRMQASSRRTDTICGKLLVFHPPGWEPSCFARLVEEYDVAVRIAKPRLTPHPGLVPWAVLERYAAPCELFDPLVEIIAFQIDGGRRDDLLFRIYLDREGDPACGLKTRITGVRTIDDLLEPDPAIERNGALVVRPRDRHLVQSGARADVEPNSGLPDRSRPSAQSGRLMESDAHEFASAGNRVGQA